MIYFGRFLFARVVGATALLVLGLAPAVADPCARQSFEGADYTVCHFDLQKDDLRLFWKGAGGAPLRTFEALSAEVQAKGLALDFAMNAGMYGADFSPIGLYVEDGKTLKSINTRTVTGSPSQIPNFYKKPNGVFLITDGAARVITTDAYQAEKPAARFATQSGPMLLIDGAIHPAFIEGSTDVKTRDGVGVSGTSDVFFAISDGVVNFYDFGRFFRDALGCQNALFLDGGSAPGLYAPELDRDDAPGHGGYGPMVAVVSE